MVHGASLPTHRSELVSVFKNTPKAARTHRSGVQLPHGAALVLALPLGLLAWAGLIFWWLA